MEVVPQDAPVLVVGAGPTGLALALTLARHGVKARVVDALEAAPESSRAVGLHARTLEILDDLGLLDAAMAAGVQCFGASFWQGGRRLVHVDFDELDSPFPFMLALPQRDLELLMVSRLEALGVVVERGMRVVDLAQREDQPVAVVLESATQRHTLDASWVIGCDGGGSMVRNALGLAFEGERHSDDVLVLDVEARTALPPDELHTVLSEDGFVVVLPLPGGARRLVISVTHEDDLGHSPTFDEVQPLLARRAPMVTVLGEPRWMARYAVSGRLAERFSQGRVFLAGDAAHVFSPFGSQGLNVGVQDAFNLGWKLGLVASGHGRLDLLDSYEAERRPVAETVLSMADRALKVVTLRSAASRAVRDRLGALLGHLESVQERVVGQFSGVRLNYAGSPICAEHRAGLLQSRLLPDPASEMPSFFDWYDFGRGPLPGWRAPDGEGLLAEGRTPARLFELIRRTRFTLLLFDGAAATAEGYAHLTRLGRAVLGHHGEHVRVVLVVPRDPPPAPLDWDGPLLLDPNGLIHRRYGASAECLYLLRPDGYVGFRAQPAAGDALLAHLDGLLIARETP